LPWPDEVLFYSPSVDFVKNFQFRTLPLEGLIPGMEVKTLWMPPFYYFSLSQWLELKSSHDLIYIRSFSSLLGIISLILVYFISRHLRWKDPRLVLLILATDCGFLQFSNLGRMESLALTFSLASILSSLKRLNFGAGVFIGFATISHPISMIHIPIILYLMNQKQNSIRDYLFFCLGGIPLAIVWIVYIFPDYHLFFYQFGLQLNRKKELFDVFGFLQRIQTVFSSYVFTKYRVVLIFLGVLIFIWEAFKTGWNEKFKFPLYYFVFILICLILTSEFYYSLYLTVPIALLFGLLFGSKNRLVYVYIGFLISFQIGYIFYLSNELRKDSGWETVWNEHNKKIQNLIPSNSSVYLQHIPEIYFKINGNYNDIKVFVPGELAILPLNYKDIVCQRDVLVISENLIHSDRTNLCNLFDTKVYDHHNIIADFKSKVFPSLNTHVFIRK
jgi:hypothetical protein